MTSGDLHVVTGAFGYSGRRIVERSIRAGHRVRTLTGSPRRDQPFGERIDVHPFSFDRPAQLERSLAGAAVLYNTYWVRFDGAEHGYDRAVANTRVLFAAAVAAGVGRVVHVSITNPSETSALGYFRGKAVLERDLRRSGLSHSILRPAVLFGGEDILINNIAWALRRLPLFGVFGDGRYRLRPIHVDDFAALAVAEGAGRTNRTFDAVGPESFTYRELVGELARALGLRRLIVPVPPAIGHFAARLLGTLVRDIVLTRDEIAGLMQGLLATDAPATGTIRLSEWAREHAATLGRSHASELGRRRGRSRRQRDRAPD